MAEPSGTLWERRVTPSEALWLAVLDQACADWGSPSVKVRAEAAEWWAGDMPALMARVLDIPLSRLPRLRDARGGLRCVADTVSKRGKIGIRVKHPTDYHYARRRPERAA